MTVQEIIQRIKDIKGNYVNGDITGDDLVEHLEDLVHDVEGNDGLDFSEDFDDDYYDNFESVDFTQLEV